MTISVIIPAYNEEKYLPRTLESISKQLRTPEEIIVVDGGSSDKTVAVAKKFGAKVLVETRRGIGFARQQGLKKALGDIVAFTDADTVVPRNWLNRIESALTDPKTVGLYGIFKVPSGWWFYRWYINYIQPTLNIFNYWLGIYMAPGQNLAFKREVGLAVGGFPEDFIIAEDIEMMTRLSKKGKVKFISDLKVLSSGRRGNEGIHLMSRVLKAMFLYFIFKRANIIGFPDIREAEIPAPKS